MAEPDTVRLFAGVAVPPAVTEPLAAALAPLRAREPELRWARPAGWHLTLAFLGDVPPTVRDPAVAVLTEVADAHATAVAPAQLTLAAAGRFGARVLWIGVGDEPVGWLATVGAGLQAGLAAAGLPVQRREVVAHLTLARAGRGPVTAGHRAAVDRVRAGLGEATWTAPALTLWRSRLDAGPARYEVVAAAPLAG